MAYDYNKAKADYEALTPEQQKQFAEQNKNDANFQKFAVEYTKEKYGTWNQTTNQSSTPVQTSTTSTNSNVAKPEYQWTGTTIQNSYKNQWEGNYTYNPTSWYYEKQGTNTGNTGNINTWTSPSYRATVANQWNSLDYAKQQELIKKDPNLKSYLQQAGLTEKSAPQTWAETPTTPETPKTWDGRDYQDNSPERMLQMANNIEKLYVTDPWLFENEDTFKKFFIDWKWRTPEQEQFLMDYYKNRQIYNKYDSYTPDALWSMYAYGKVPESYINYLKNSNPDRYNAIMEAKDREQDKISNKSYYNTQLEQAWFESSDTTNLSWQKKEWLLVDENGDLIDDRRYHEPSEQERVMVERANEIVARRLEIKNISKNLEKDLTAAYPWATKATIVALVNDRMSELHLEDDDLAVELAQLQGQITYEQNERQQQDKAGSDTITQLQKNLWMYYEYTPEGMSELLNAQYEAANPSLASAENWTETEKRRALDSVLSGYYDKYSSIIERPKEQVISDVIAYANKNWVTLEQALQENFITPLKSKDQYETLASWWWSSYKFASYEWADWVKHTIRYNEATWEWEEIFWDEATYWSDGTVKFWESIRTWDTIWNDINSIWHILASDDWIRVWTYKSSNWYTYNVYADREDWIKATENLLRKWYYWMTLADAAQKWIWQWKDISDAKSVIKQMWLWLNDKLSDANVKKFIEAIWTWEWTLKWQSLDEWAKQWVNDFSQYKSQPSTTEFWYWENPMTDMIAKMRVSWDLNSDEKKDLNFASKAYELMYELASSWDIDYLINSDEWQKFISNLKSASFTKNNEDATWTQVYNALKNNITDQRNLRTVNKLINIIELKLRKTSWAAIAASEWNSNFDMLLPWVNEIPSVSLDKYRNFEKIYLMDYFNSAGSKTKWYKYIPLFSEDSPYYTKYKGYWDRFPISNKWIVWIRWINYGSNWTWRSSNDIYSQIWFDN